MAAKTGLLVLLGAALTVASAAEAQYSKRPAKLDFNGDGRSELALFDNGYWAAMTHDKSYFREKRLGSKSSVLVPGFYAAGRSRMAFQSSEIGSWPQYPAVFNAGNWIVQDMDETVWKMQAAFGFRGSQPVPGDYDGDGVVDLAVYSKGVWYIMQSRKGYRQINFGFDGASPIVGDFNNNGRDDPAVVWVDAKTKLLRWAIYFSPTSVRTFSFGPQNAIPVPGYYFGPAYGMNPAVWAVDAKKIGAFYISKTGGADSNPIVLPLGKDGDTPVGGCDFDGDGKDDIAVYNSGRWWLGMSVAGGKVVDFGYKGANPVARSSFSQAPDHLPIIEPKDFNGTLWKTPNHSGDGTVVLLASKYMTEYKAGVWASAVVSSDPSGRDIRPGGVGRFVAPYHDRPAIRFDKVGTFYRPGPVYMVLIYKDGRRQPWLIPDPGVRTE